MKLLRFTATNDGRVLVEFRIGSEEGWYPITTEEAEQLQRHLKFALIDAKTMQGINERETE